MTFSAGTASIARGRCLIYRRLIVIWGRFDVTTLKLPVFRQLQTWIFALSALAAIAVVWMFFGGYLALVALILILVIVFMMNFFGREVSAREGFQGLSAALSSLALLLAGYWYFIDRHGVPKLELEPVVYAWPVKGNAVLVWVDDRLTNIGRLPLKFSANDKRNVMRVQVGQVTPLAGKEATGLMTAMQAGLAREEKEFNLLQSDKWPSRALFEAPIISEIEAGESEHLYFKGIIPCAEGMTLSVVAAIPKRLQLVGNRMFGNAGDKSWIAQSMTAEPLTCRT